MGESNEPPDYWLTYHGKRYAVEVTSSKFYIDTLLDEGKVEEKTFLKSYGYYVKDIEKKAKAKGILKGAYRVHFPKPLSDTNDGQYKRNLLPKILQYIKTTSELDETDYKGLLLGDVVVCKIRKIHGKKDVVYPSWGARWIFLNAPENDEQILQLLQYAVVEKVRKMKSVNEPKILLYYDTYCTSMLENYLIIASKLKNVEAFHSVYVILDGEIVIRVYGDSLSK